MLIGWIMELIAVCSAHWVILSTYDRNSYNQLVGNTQAHGLWTSCTGVFALFPICHDTPENGTGQRQTNKTQHNTESEKDEQH
jgi:hypothetical protein